MYTGAALLLLAAVGGYWVLERAASHRGRLKQVGQLLGGLIIILSLIAVGCKVWHLTTWKKDSHHFGKTGKDWSHHRAPIKSPAPSD